MLLWEAWQDLTLIILMIAAVALLVLGIMTKGIKEGWYDGGSIAFAVILVVVVTAISDYTQSLQFQNLFEAKRNTHLKVTRVNGRVEVSKYDLVVGDVVHLSTGDQVPADGVLIPGHSLAINESSMTGESEIVHKDANDPFLMYGCKVVGGKGTMLVTSAGMSISEDTGEETPLQVQLNEIATFIGVVGLSVAVVVLVVLLAGFFAGHTKTPDGSVQVKVGKTSVSDAVDGVIKIITIAVTIAVVAVPEGLPLAVTLTLARSMRKMRADRALVRRLSACKTMVSVTTICTDKTAILTSNQDPCPGVQDEVRRCRNAGVKVQMVTGDNMQNAKAIALECGILDSEAEATLPNLIEGKAFRSLTDAEREEAAEKISVMGRSSPNDKLLLVQALKRRGEIVAVTGDDTNDVPALCEADVGLAMGIQATEVAKESSDIMILDDNFASVFKVLKWGRSVYANIQKSVQFQLTVNVSALTINSIAAVFLGCVPLNAVQLLWVNLITNTLGAFALATEPPTDDLMHMDPVDRRECLVTDPIWGHIRKQAAYQASVLLFLLFQGRSLLNLEHDTSDHANKVINTLIFNTFVLCQIVNEFNAWNPDKFNVFGGITKNHLFTGMVVLTLILQVIIIEFFGKFTSTVRLDRKQWIIAIIIAFIGWPVDAIPI